MATYKVLQDIEAEDKLVGPLTLWQFIYALGAGLCIYLSTIAVMKNMPYFLIILVPVGLFVGFLAIPWSGEQPTEVWALAKLRFFLKPRRRIWDQSGMTELVTVTAPKHEARIYTNGLSQTEVRSRLHALASTLDSRGWAVKNVNVNMTSAAPTYSPSDRLVDVATNIPESSIVDIRPDDDMLDEKANPLAQTFDAMIDKAASDYHKAIIDRMNQPLPSPAPAQPAGVTAEQTPTAAQQWFTAHPSAANPITEPARIEQTVAIQNTVEAPQASEPTADEEALLASSRANETKQSAAYGRLKTVKTPEQIEEEQRAEAKARADAEAEKRASEAMMTSEKQAAIINWSRRDDLNIDALIRQAKHDIADDGEVIVPLR